MHRTVMIAAVAIAATGCVGTEPDPNWTPSFRPTSSALERRDQPVTADDLLILRRAAGILEEFEHRLRDFNNTRTHAEILEVLTMATERVESRLRGQ